MGRGGDIGYERNSRRKGWSKYKGSDESDEDYTVGEDEESRDSDEYHSFDGEESKVSLGEFEEEDDEEEEERKKVKKIVRSKSRKGFSHRKTNGFEKLQKKKRVSYKEEDDDDYDDDDDDEEFMPDGIDCLDDEDELPVMKKHKKVGRPPLQKNGLVKGRKRKRICKVLKKHARKKPRNNFGLRRKASSSNDSEFTEKNQLVEDRGMKVSGWRKTRRLTMNSDPEFMSPGSSDYECAIMNNDSGFMSSGSSDCEYTISEEEREQVREASEFCRSLTTSLRSSSLSKRFQEKGTLSQQRKSQRRKGKEKIEDMKNEGGKQICGICLSEEGKETVQGTLNCCSHYFCFACIMEWSKVESRCPLCKQRFMTISKPAGLKTGFDLRTVVIQVPERDQVYQPSDEELRGFLDPYESVICTECRQGGDDALMLLCDICDSPTHTYCAGLGREVPEGNWYCEGCRPTALGSSNPHDLNAMPNQRISNNLSGGLSSVGNVRGGFDLNAVYVPNTPATERTESFQSPRHPVGDIQAASPRSGLGAFTVLERRRIHRQIHNLLSNRMRQLGSGRNGISASNPTESFFISEIDRGRD